MDTVTSARQPRSALDWLRKGVSLLADLAADLWPDDKYAEITRDTRPNGGQQTEGGQR